MRYHTHWKYKPFLFALDTLGTFFFFWNRWKTWDEKRIKKILIIRLDHLGDVVLTTPVFSSLRKKFPDADISVLVRPFAKDILVGNKDIDKILTLNPPWFSREKTSIWTLCSFVRSHYKKYDAVIELHADPRNIVLASLLGRYKVGYSIRGFGFLLNKKVEFLDGKHSIEKNLAVVQALGAHTKSRMQMCILPKAKKSAEVIFRKNKLEKVVCINPGSGRQSKYWNQKQWAVVADYLIGKKYLILFTGTSSDALEVKKIREWMKQKQGVLNLCGKTNVQELAAVIKKSVLFLSTDTGPMHIARAVGTPLLGLFGPTDAKVWGYNEGKFRSIQAKTCDYCKKTAVYNRSENKCKCMGNISTEEVLSLVKKMLPSNT